KYLKTCSSALNMAGVVRYNSRRFGVWVSAKSLKPCFPSDSDPKKRSSASSISGRAMSSNAPPDAGRTVAFFPINSREGARNDNGDLVLIGSRFSFQAESEEAAPPRHR